MVMEQLDTHIKNNNNNNESRQRPKLFICASKYIRDFNLKYKSTYLLEENIGEILVVLESMVINFRYNAKDVWLKKKNG